MHEQAMRADSACPRCGCRVGDLVHIGWDCPRRREAWMGAGQRAIEAIDYRTVKGHAEGAKLLWVRGIAPHTLFYEELAPAGAEARRIIGEPVSGW